MDSLIVVDKGREGAIAQCMICTLEMDSQAPRLAHATQPGHAAHVACFERWLKIKSTCPFCRISIDRTSLMTKSERAVSLYKKELSAFKFGLACGMSGSVIAVVVAGVREVVDSMNIGRPHSTNSGKDEHLQSGEMILCFAIGNGAAIIWVAKKLSEAYITPEMDRSIHKIVGLSLALSGAAAFFPLSQVTPIILVACGCFSKMNLLYKKWRRAE